MAGEWIKWTKGLTRKREVAVLASKLGRDRREIAGRLMELWEWCDDNLSDTDFDESGNATVVIGDLAFVDETVGLDGFAAAMASPEVSWLIPGDGGRVTFPNFDNHNGNTAKKRSYEQKKKANQRKEAIKMSPKCPHDTGTKMGTRREETRGDERREENSKRGGTPNGAPTDLPPLDDSGSKVGKASGPHPDPIDLSGMDWGQAVQMAVTISKSIPPIDRDDRRMWFKLGVMSQVTFSEHWLLDSIQAVVQAKDHKRSRQAHLVGVLKSKAAKEGIDASAFRELLSRIEIPADVWKSNVLKVKA